MVRTRISKRVYFKGWKLNAAVCRAAGATLVVECPRALVWYVHRGWTNGVEYYPVGHPEAVTTSVLRCVEAVEPLLLPQSLFRNPDNRSSVVKRQRRLRAKWSYHKSPLPEDVWDHIFFLAAGFLFHEDLKELRRLTETAILKPVLRDMERFITVRNDERFEGSYVRVQRYLEDRRRKQTTAAALVSASRGSFRKQRAGLLWLASSFGVFVAVTLFQFRHESR